MLVVLVYLVWLSYVCHVGSGWGSYVCHVGTIIDTIVTGIGSKSCDAIASIHL